MPKCIHKSISEPRKRTARDGHTQIWKQCLDCGKPVEGPIKHNKVKGLILEDFKEQKGPAMCETDYRTLIRQTSGPVAGTGKEKNPIINITYNKLVKLNPDDLDSLPF